jgi:signal transduction histidine kinase
MANLLKSISELLTSQTGSLVYHLVLAFCAAGALQMSFNHHQRQLAQVRRMVFGLGMILALQLLLFVVSGLAWQGILEGEIWLPVLELAAGLIAIILVVWLWCFPEPNPSADAAALLMALIIVTASVLGGLWWSQQEPGTSLSATWLDLAYQVTSLGILGLGVIILVRRRPEGWTLGVWMLLLWSTGNILELVYPGTGDYYGLLRLMQMSAFPFLLFLPQRSFAAASSLSAPAGQLSQASASSEGHSLLAKERMYADPALWQALGQLASENDVDSVCRQVVALVGRSMQAEICLLVAPPDSAGKITFLCGYDITTKKYLAPGAVESRDLPLITSSFRMGRGRRLPSSTTSTDYLVLGRALNLDRIGNMLFAPVLTPDGNTIVSLILLSPYSGRDWNPDEQDFLSTLSRLLVQFLQRSKTMDDLREEVTQARQSARLAQEQAQLAVDERQKLRDKLAVLQEDVEHDRSQLTSVTAMVAAHAMTQELVEKLKAENEQLKQTIQTVSQQEMPLESELRLSLEEVAYLKLALADADRRIGMLKSNGASSQTSCNLQEMLTIAQDLRQPLSSVMGYTDLLLREEVGILGNMQRKYLERIKVSTERMNRLVDDLITATVMEGAPPRLDLEQVDVCAVVNDAIVDTDPKLRERQIALQVDLPDDPLSITTDRQTLRKIVGQFIVNASQATPAGSQIAVTASLQSADGDQDYVLVRIHDRGEGILPRDLPRIFSPRREGQKFPGLGESDVDLPGVKNLVELLGGRTWVDSDPGHGSTFSVLLPAIPEQIDGNGLL